MPFGTGPNDPWYYNQYFQIGPFTGSDQSNSAANDQRSKLLKGLPGLVPPATKGVAPGSHTLQQTYGDPVAAALDTAAMQPGVTQFPSVTIPTTPAQRAANSQSAPIINPPQQPASHYGLLPDVPDTVYLGGTEARPSTVPGSPAIPNPNAAPVPASDPTLPQSAPVPYAPPPNPVPPDDSTTAAVPSAASPNGVDQNSMEFVQNILKAIGYPAAPDTSNPKQDAADAYAAHEMDRTRLLARLAFAGGLTASAGGQWEGVGKGFMQAANVYDKGQQRYMKALQNSADRYSEDQKAAYGYKAKKAGIMADLYTAGERQKLEQQKLVRDAAKDRQEILIRQLGLTDPKPAAGDFTTPEEEEKRRERLMRSFQLGRPVIYNDVSD
jgi:hypothetical protein